MAQFNPRDRHGITQRHQLVHRQYRFAHIGINRKGEVLRAGQIGGQQTTDQRHLFSAPDPDVELVGPNLSSRLEISTIDFNFIPMLVLLDVYIAA